MLDQQPADASIAVEKRMNRFKVVVDQRDAQKDRHRRRFMQEALEVIEGCMHLLNRWRHIRRVIDSRA